MSAHHKRAFLRLVTDYKVRSISGWTQFQLILLQLLSSPLPSLLFFLFSRFLLLLSPTRTFPSAPSGTSHHPGSLPASEQC